MIRVSKYHVVSSTDHKSSSVSDLEVSRRNSYFATGNLNVHELEAGGQGIGNKGSIDREQR